MDGYLLWLMDTTLKYDRRILLMLMATPKGLMDTLMCSALHSVQSFVRFYVCTYVSMYACMGFFSVALYLEKKGGGKSHVI